MLELVCKNCALGVLAIQALAFLALGLAMLIDRVPSERQTATAVRWIYSCAFGLALIAAITLALSGQTQVQVPIGNWVQIHDEYNFHLILLLDRLSVPFLLLATGLCGVVAVFSEKYLHREPGYYRFFLLLCLFGLGDSLTVLSGSMEMLYSAWELIGLSSALLIAFFHDREGPVRNGLYAFVAYRLSDLGLVIAGVSIANLHMSSDFSTFLGNQAWPAGTTVLPPEGATAVGLLLLLAAAGKSAQVPFSGWLPRAMEGPTPSTAIFYGALSVHAGAYLLLRCESILDSSPLVSALVVVVGLTTAMMARFVGRVQSDIKCSLVYASLAQVGLIFAEIGLGFRLVAVAHACGHAVWRSVQFLRAPSLMQERHELSSAMGDHPEHHQQKLAKVSKFEQWSFRVALERGFLEHIVERWLVLPFLMICRLLQRIDKMVLSLIAGPDASERSSQ
jgi:NADH:ubiquinone oxidoreductase subunit 5 (subunit L)/multisubunit Na+/H+ antiporter MnhA subunit